ncbi:GDP-L-fucose synthase [Imperialibacter roseus]|uniref:GDP-L-fucose synthase n=1 Tax=Imperialibacter roseus TaxID=1324217 RepID=A0ABZ0IN49_9BACT|nr:GDP-L-fucose synthase [Imperialibacter roseus]WOK06467.1 GDP-L-fucose synthase [Imperialibacter roseus]
MHKESKVFIAGHRGMVGSAILRGLQKRGFSNFVLKTSAECDLRRQADVESLFEVERPDYVFLAAAKVGGINANNTYRAEFLHDNLMIQNNVIHSAWKFQSTKLMFLGSSCIYPKLAPQPLKEDYLLTGLLEETNEPYAIAKIAGIKMCEAYRDQYGCNFVSVMPTNLYGPNDNYDLKNSHVLPALIRKFHDAKVSGASEVEVWGTGSPKREFLHVDDMAEACIYLMEKFDAKPHSKAPSFLNIGWGEDISIKDLGLLIKDIVGFQGTLKFDTSKPDGTPRKLMDTSRLSAMGFKPTITLEQGIGSVYREFVKTYSSSGIRL